jgi:NAD(P)-dependent dehydrogenase (short-subunit alcohol dehydrogenase family)
MELPGATVVVTGGGAGIGEALARRFAASGAQVVVNDIDASRAQRVAHDIGGHAVACDAATDEGVAWLVGSARARFGEIDLYCANAGVGRGGGPEAPEEAWAVSWEVNVMAHVRAARALLPAWLERGRGHFLATVSAAGLLSHITAAPYAVSKHAALAFAEWLAIAYGDHGITVQALCPQGVRTSMLMNEDGPGKALLLPDALSPEEVADTVAEALTTEQFLILPHPEVARYIVNRATDPDRWLSGMRRTLRASEREASSSRSARLRTAQGAFGAETPGGPASPGKTR